MSNDYQQIKIANEIIIVERDQAYRSWVDWRDVKGQGMHQGYIVDAGNKKMLETAKKWASYTYYDDSLFQLYQDYKHEHHADATCDAEAEKIWKQYKASAKHIEGIEHKYQNGQFEITLCDSAHGSSQGGKLSFWNCIITCPDGKEFLVGINADILLELLLKNTFVDGKCQSKVWLGRIGGKQVGAFTASMELYDQAQKDEATRQSVAKKTVKYQAGDILATLTSKSVYLGTAYKYYDIYRRHYWYYGSNSKEYLIVTYNQPKIAHVYANYRDDNTLGWYETTNTKVARTVTGHLDDDKMQFAVDYIHTVAQEELDKELTSKSPYSYYMWNDYCKLRMYGTSALANIDNLLDGLRLDYQKAHNKDKDKGTFDDNYKVISEEEWNNMPSREQSDYTIRNL